MSASLSGSGGGLDLAVRVVLGVPQRVAVGVGDVGRGARGVGHDDGQLHGHRLHHLAWDVR
jgi:hypothetical protein